MSSSEWSAFVGELGDITPLSQDTLAHSAKTDRDTVSLAARRAAAETAAQDSPLYLSLESVDLLRPDDIVGYKKDGVQDGVFKKLRLGQYPCEARLDLHKHTVAQARKAQLDFIRDCLRQDRRSLIVIHGKGQHNQPPALLKSYVSGWLKQIPGVLAYHSTQRHHGSTGSLYVLLRKSEQAKQEARERHQSRQG